VIKVSVVSGKRLLKMLRAIGFEVTRIDGSHHALRHPDGRATTVPVHGNEDIGRPLLLRILDQAGLSKDDYLTLRNTH
jgi:predicted RNA binding protein YcfA (HicA-like mRNA interferase family)